MSISSLMEHLSVLNSFLSTPLLFLLSQNEFYSYYTNQYLRCKGTGHRECVLSLLRNLQLNLSLDYSILRLERKVIEYIQETKKDISESISPIEVIECVLVNLHCNFVYEKCYESGEIFASECSSKCLLHKHFILNIKEQRICRCGSVNEEEWEDKTISQYLSITSIFSGSSDKTREYKTTNLKSNLDLSNSLNYRGKILKTLTSFMENASLDICLNTHCNIKNTKLNFSVNKASTFYTLDFFYGDHSLGFLESFLASVGIDQVLQIKDIYREGVNKLYRLQAVFFFNGQSRLALLEDGLWRMQGKKNSGTWLDILQEALIFNLHPACLVYKETQKEDEQEIVSDLELKRMELIAIKSDFYKDRIDVASLQSFIREELKNRNSLLEEFEIGENAPGKKNTEEVKILVKSKFSEFCDNCSEKAFRICIKCSPFLVLCEDCCIQHAIKLSHAPVKISEDYKESVVKKRNKKNIFQGKTFIMSKTNEILDKVALSSDMCIKKVSELEKIVDSNSDFFRIVYDKNEEENMINSLHKLFKIEKEKLDC